MAYQGGGGYTSRGGLNPRSHLMGGSDQVQISIDPGKTEFDAHVQSLRQDVFKVKELAYAIDRERQLQGEEISKLEATMEKASAMLRGSMRRLNVVYNQSRSNFMLYLILFAIGMFIFVYMMGKLYRLGRWFF